MQSRRAWPALAARSIRLWVAVLAGLCVGSSALAEPGKSLLLRYRSHGDRAVTECAEQLWRSGERFRDFTADHSDSLDRWHERHRPQEVRALFRKADGSPIAMQARRMAERISRRTKKPKTRSRNPVRAMRNGAALRQASSELAQVYEIVLPEDQDLSAALAELRADPHVAYAQINHAYRLDFEPNDPFLSSEGSWSQPFADLWGLDRIGARQAWQTTRGAGQIVAVVDTGLDYLHPDIAENVWVNPGEDLDGDGRVDAEDWNGIDDDDNGFVDDLRGYDFAGFGDPLSDGSTSVGDPDPFDENGHGTHVAGTVAAVADNGIGIAGVAPEALVMPLKGFGSEGRGRDSDLWRAVLYAIENGADVINASWSCSPACPENPLADEVLAVAELAGVVFVTSAGNNASDVIRSEPERSNAAISVGSLGFDDALSSFSNRGWLVDLLAPGGGPSGGPVLAARRNILSLAASSLPVVEAAFRVEELYFRLAGTSMAAPHVAGAIALLRAQRPGLSTADVRRLLRLSARDLPPAGLDPLHGSGALDLPRLLETELPDLDLAIETPLPGRLHDPLSGPLEIGVRASGSAASSFSLAYSRGLSTQDFDEIDDWTDSGTGGRRVLWHVDALEDGPYVLRLRARLEDGRSVDEVSVFSLERIRPLRLSDQAFDETGPSVDGARVVWQANPDPSSRVGQLRVGGFTRNGQAKSPMLLEGPPDRSRISPIVSGRRVVWREFEPDSTDGEELRGCKLRGRFELRCDSELLAAESTRLDPFGFARKRVLWSRRITGFELFGCVWRLGRGCRPRRIDAAPGADASSRLLDFDGRTAIWKPARPGSPLEFCTPVLRGGDCIPRPLVEIGRSKLAESASIHGRLLAFEVFRLVGSAIAYCELDLETGACDSRVIEGIRDGRKPDVAGRRIVWTDFVDGEEPHVALCEVRSGSGECVRQRLTGTTAAAAAARLSRKHVVWQDERAGPSQIFGLGLPELTFRRRIRVRVGQRVRIPIVGLVGGRAEAGLQLFLAPSTGPVPDDLDASLERRSARLALLEFRPKPSHSGQTSVWEIKGVSAAGLETRRTLEIRVEPRRRGARRSK